MKTIMKSMMLMCVCVLYLNLMFSCNFSRNEEIYEIDSDGDGYSVSVDCDDNDSDNWKSCLNCVDIDGDGYSTGCDQFLIYKGPDCDDGSPEIFPSAFEVYGDSIDQDCDGHDPDKFLIDPYLQLGNQTSNPNINSQITVAWETSTPQTGTVFYGLTFPPQNRIDNTVTALRHEIEITNLKPDSNYYYQAIAGASSGQVSSFRTPPIKEDPSFDFAVIGDTRSLHTPHKDLIEMMTDWAPAFYIHAGDMVNNGGVKEEWVIFFYIENMLARSALLAPTIGNHDIALYRDHFSVPINLNPQELIYSWDYGSVHFIHLSTEYVGPAQDAILISDLEKAGASYPSTRFIVVVMHRNAYATSGHTGDENYAYSTIWGPQFEKYNVAMVIQAHCHFYERFEPIMDRAGLGDPPGEPDVITKGVTYVTSGGGGAPLYTVNSPPGNGGGGTPPLDSLVAKRANQALLVKVRGNLLHVQSISSPDRKVIDEFYIER